MPLSHCHDGLRFVARAHSNRLSTLSLLVMGIGNVFKIDDRYINIDRLSIIGDNGDHSPNFFRQTSLLFHEWLAERFNLEDA
jgi:hypothetical protein